jgi:hypothetical protein
VSPDRLHVEADLSIDVGGETVRVTGGGDRLRVEAPSFRAARRLLDGTATLPVGVDLGAADRLGAPVTIAVRGRTVARVGGEVRPNWSARLAGVAPARVSLRGVLRALIG